MATLDDILDAGDERRERTRDAGRAILGHVRLGLWGIGWVLAKAVLLALTAVAAVFFAIGWTARRSVPVLRWTRAAVAIGWDAGHGRTELERR